MGVWSMKATVTNQQGSSNKTLNGPWQEQPLFMTMCLICRFLLHVCICLHICSNVKWTAAPLSALSYCLVLLMFYLVSSFLNLFQQSEVEMTSPLQGYRIQVSNLHPNVSHEDITVCISYDDIT